MLNAQSCNIMNTVSVESLEKSFDKFGKNVQDTALKILKILKQDDKIVEIYLVGNGKSRELNKKFRDKDKATNILSFEEPADFISPKVDYVQPKADFFSIKTKKRKLGEIYLNIRMTKDWAGKKNLFSADELLAHGILHLLGYDHQKKGDRVKMENKELEIIKKI